jgi:hypothetical protein
MCREQAIERPQLHVVAAADDCPGWAMKIIFPIFGIFALVLLAEEAPGQVPSEKPSPLPIRSVQITIEQGHVIKEYLLKDPTIKKEAGTASLSPGDAAPQGIELRPFPSDVTSKVPRIKSYVFFVRGEQIVIVDPKDNKIADVIE